MICFDNLYTLLKKISSHWSAEKVCDVLKNEVDLKIQPDENQTPYKVSYYLHRASPERLHELEARLRQAGIRCNHIYSSQCDLDFLPPGVNKGAAAAFLLDFLNRPRETVLAAGNSGNDVTLFEKNFAGIIVANAHECLKKYKDDRRVYLANDPYADGVREGIEYWTERLSAQVH
ncbi:MAG: hypothetical protein EOM20_04655 [Spartobacteria bacterium]|nr:hypothetical protein [Spartobacteria bacterium]